MGGIREAGFEPATFGFGGQRSIQLSYPRLVGMLFGGSMLRFVVYSGCVCVAIKKRVGLSLVIRVSWGKVMLGGGSKDGAMVVVWLANSWWYIAG